MTNKGKMIEAVYAASLTKRATLVIFYLINRSNEELSCFPSVKTIGKECNMSMRTVQRALNDLEEAGFISRESRFYECGGQRSNIYVLKNPEKTVEEVDVITFSCKKAGNSSDEIENTLKFKSDSSRINHDGFCIQRQFTNDSREVPCQLESVDFDYYLDRLFGSSNGVDSITNGYKSACIEQAIESG